MLKATNRQQEIANLYFNTNWTMQEIADRFNLTRQNISLLVIQYVRRRNIKFFDEYHYKCRICDSIIIKIKQRKTIRKDFIRIINRVRFVCDDCKRLKLGRCYNCGAVGYDFYIVNGKPWSLCKECNSEKTKEWVSNNRDKWNRYQRKWASKNKNKTIK